MQKTVSKIPRYHFLPTVLDAYQHLLKTKKDKKLTAKIILQITLDLERTPTYECDLDIQDISEETI